MRFSHMHASCCVWPRSVSGLHEEWSSNMEWREKWAEVQGSVSGLHDEQRQLARRLEGLDERLWARTSSLEQARHRSQDLEQQVQAVEHQNQVMAASIEGAQKRQLAKLARSERLLEELTRRVGRAEE
ncbi:unnamed protein product, partial [Prorocentrum cordatum]